MTIIKLNMEFSDDLQKQYDENKDHFDRMFCKLINKYSVNKDDEEKTLENFRGDVDTYEVFYLFAQQIFKSIKSYRTRCTLNLQTMILGISIDEMKSLVSADANHATSGEQD